MPPDVLSRELGENVQSVRALESVHTMNHQEPNVQKQPSEDLTAERQWSNQTRERTIERAEEIQPVPFVGQKLIIQGTGFLLRLWKTRKTCTITSRRTLGSLPVCVKKRGTSSSAIPVKHHGTCVFLSI